MTGNDDHEKNDDKIVEFPKTPEERKALRKAKQDQEKQRLINVFIDEAGGDRALFHAPDETAFADIIVDGHRETWPVRSRQFRFAYMRFLRRQFDQLVNTNPLLAAMVKPTMSKSSINAAIDDFEARAICASTVREVYVFASPTTTAISISILEPRPGMPYVSRVPAGAPSNFRRCDSRRMPGMLSLPMPARGGKIETLRSFLNTADSDFTLVVAYLVASLYPAGPYSILILYGEHGAAKTNFLRRLRMLIDPHATPTTRLPLSERDLFIAARNSHMQAFQNVSKLSDAMSDSLCRLSDGGGLRTRKMFKDDDEALFGGARPIAMEGINNVVTRPDLQSRVIILQLPNISHYKTERQLRVEFEQQLPKIFGAVLDMMVRGLKMLPDTELANPPRLADFAHWAVACGIEGFEPAYAANRQNAIEVMLSHDPIAKAVRALLANRKEWDGGMEDLLDVVGPTTGIKSTKKLSDELLRLAPMLRSVGIDVLMRGALQRTAGQRPVRIERIAAGGQLLV